MSHRLGEAIQYYGQQHYAEAADGGESHIEPAYAAQHHLAKAPDRYHGGDHHHGERQHQGLVDPGHDGGHGERQLNLEQQLGGAGTERVGRLHQIGGHLTNTQHGEPDHGGQGEDDGHHHPGHVAYAKQHDDGDEVDKRRGGLHGIQQRPSPGGEPLAAGQQYAHRQAYQHAEEQRGQHQGEGHHGIGPGPDKADPHKRRERAERHAAAHQLPGDQGQEPHHQGGGHRLQQLGHGPQRQLHGGADQLEHRPQVLHQPAYAPLDPGIQRHHGLLEGIQPVDGSTVVDGCDLALPVCRLRGRTAPGILGWRGGGRSAPGIGLRLVGPGGSAGQ